MSQKSPFVALTVFFAALSSGCSLGPRPAVTAPATAEPEPVAHTYRTIAGQDLPAYVFAPTGKQVRNAAILLFHGGGWFMGDATWVFPAAQRFADLGLVAIAIEYRLSDAGTTPIDALEDTCAAFAWARSQARELGFDPKRVAGYGVSAGGHLAATAATIGCGTSDGSFGVGGPDALVLWSPAVDVADSGWFERLLQGKALPADYSPVEHLGKRLPPTSIVQGTEDSVTRLAGARRFCAGVQAAGEVCALEEFPGLGHLLTRNLAHQEDDFDPDPVARAEGWKRQNEFLVRLWGR
jgi:acetyl esterase